MVTELDALEIPKEMQKEVRVLSELGIAKYEIEYLVHMRTKQDLGKRWQ